ncbi:flagellar biosynthetic protein FliO [Polynucleobacter sp. CS-Odin-A6]|uniref:flagellar biosynthetic protein FliO n=1 Tax=Polynucleobacter sp. CS-Odin-A6 TaxID=2689106 RepID=UPI001C0C2341|nr:flagellar biosynthetic protein FliO [Polynucleobacter sp. CS-Odin-A6]MBU3621854.1 flagellar biosynthetic protein FliO [Polynucleobacter sp. CS-Odin-A6]
MFNLRHLFLIISLFFSEMAIAQITRVPEAEGGPFRVILGLILVLALIAILAWVMKKFNHAKIGNQSVAKIVGGVSVGSRERVVVVEIGGHWVVVGVASGQVTSLANFNIADLDFGENAQNEPEFYEENSGSSVSRSTREKRASEPRFEFRSEFDQNQIREEQVFTSALSSTKESKFNKENIKRILRKLL